MQEYHLNDVISDVLKKIEKDNFARTWSMDKDNLRFWPSQASIEYYPLKKDISGKVIGQQSEIAVKDGACLRSSYWSMKGEPKTNKTSGKNILKMMAGKKIEIGVLDYIQDAGFLFKGGHKFRFHVDPKTSEIKNKKSKNTLTISGELDAIFLDPITKALVGAELKSSYGYWFTKQTIKGNNPKLNNLLQTMLYLHNFQKNLNPDVDIPMEYFQLIYFDRGDFGIKSYNVYLTEVDGYLMPVVNGEVWNNLAIQGIYTRFAELKKAFITDTLPDRDYQLYFTKERVEELYSIGAISKTAYALHKKTGEKGDFWCSYCAYKSKCWGSDSNSQI